MTSRLSVEQPEQYKGGFGTGGVRFVPYREGRPIAAERRRLSGSASIQVGEDFADYRAEYYVYLQHPIREHWRVRDLETGVLYEVKTFFPDRGNNLHRLCCERVNT